MAPLISKGKVEIWRVARSGTQHGIARSWEEDHYRVSRPMERDGEKVFGPDGKQQTEILVESLVDENFKKMHKPEYDAFIKENGEPKDERY